MLLEEIIPYLGLIGDISKKDEGPQEHLSNKVHSMQPPFDLVTNNNVSCYYTSLFRNKRFMLDEMTLSEILINKAS